MVKQNLVCEDAKVCPSARRVFYKNSRLLENKFKYDMYTSAGKPNQQERKVYPQIKYYVYTVNLSWV
jgi:hypothetical protein